MRNTIQKQTVELGKKYDLQLDGNITENFKAIASAETGVEIEGNNLTEVVTNFVENYTPGQGGGGQTPVKGGTVLIDDKQYLVLDANEDLTNVKLMLLSIDSSKYYESSPSSEQKVEFPTASDPILGVKYAGSVLDTYCNETFLATLPQEVQDAIIEQEVVQDMYAAGFVEEDANTVLQTKQIGSANVYRVNKMNTESIAVGTRKIRSLNMNDITTFLNTDGSTVLDGEVLNDMIFGVNKQVNIYAWLADACSDYSYGALYVYGDFGSVSLSSVDNDHVARPTFSINWKSIN